MWGVLGMEHKALYMLGKFYLQSYSPSPRLKSEHMQSDHKFQCPVFLTVITLSFPKTFLDCSRCSVQFNNHNQETAINDDFALIDGILNSH